ncbi:MAG: hypothetical protein JSS20_16305 [Proteobacteria bacterium]|nr:hypothetical protein [Pseudomonadota bacterium]
MGLPQAAALAGGLVCVALTAANLLGDTADHFGLEHYKTLGFLFITIVFGLVAKGALLHRNYANAAAFYSIFAACTVLVVYSSVGRQHSTAAEAEASATNANTTLHNMQGEKTRADNEIADLRRQLAQFVGVPSPSEVQGALDAVVGSGTGRVPSDVWRRTENCTSSKITKAESAAACKPALDLRILNGKSLERASIQKQIAALEARRTKLVEKIDAVGGERPIPGKARGFAEVAGLLGYSPDRVEFVMSRLDKVLLALVLELGGVLGIEFGLAGLLHPARPAHTTATPPAPVAEAPRPTPPSGGRRTRKLERPSRAMIETRKAAARADVITFRRPVAQADLASRWGVCKSMVTCWLIEWENAGLITRTRHGRTVSVQAVQSLRAVA